MEGIESRTLVLAFDGHVRRSEADLLTQSFMAMAYIHTLRSVYHELGKHASARASSLKGPLRGACMYSSTMLWKASLGQSPRCSDTNENHRTPFLTCVISSLWACGAGGGGKGNGEESIQEW
jgi:hypothetical protein